ncbi:cobyric acid synthase [Xenorhabdus bovienii]|uniref:Cobyric acid synthase n=1 Tax=Xenorhabdus bovienii TaxID=40576 RepID=A0AAJ1N4F2_XENBV|nr:cobyric acid synthase [Xenorhabdus bovienii]MDE1478961.1 cobyric acid synthase [Xenorhabdus bovienii]MDE1491360.1 cobyric acid synthase [Xenorhabdus bovienii]MDE9510482.1 cobyric acid synthase [Xenorhabdus bovienii]MDE9522273.1 cobyric acid synthase [Xenorhabdus bovienii]
MTLSLMIQGTASDVGKSVLVAGFCRIFLQDGYHCIPFKSQNMALNSGITADGKEMGRAQIFQAEAAGIEPDVRMNPVLLKPTSDRKAQVIFMGKVVCSMNAVEYHEYKPQLQQQILAAYDSLAAETDIMVLEGAGSPAEINLRDRDIVNMGMAELADVPVILVADIDRGGVFAAIYGTLALLRPEERARVKGVIINKFRGDPALLQSGIDQIEELTQVPILGVLPWLDLDLEDEDSVALQVGKYAHSGKNAENWLDIAVIQLPHIANFTDFNALAAQPDVHLHYVSDLSALNGSDLIVLPGSKNTLGDLSWLKIQGLDQAIIAAHQSGIPIIGICGGYQMLGKQIIDEVESGLNRMAGLGLLDADTQFANEKHTAQVKGVVMPELTGMLNSCSEQPIAGYEIHMGMTQLGEQARPFAKMHLRNGEETVWFDGAVNQSGSVMGSYLHGLFDQNTFTRPLLNQLRRQKGLAPLENVMFNYVQHKEKQFNILAASMREHLDIDRIYQLMKEHEEHH